MVATIEASWERTAKQVSYKRISKGKGASREEVASRESI